MINLLLSAFNQQTFTVIMHATKGTLFKIQKYSLVKVFFYRIIRKMFKASFSSGQLGNILVMQMFSLIGILRYITK